MWKRDETIGNKEFPGCQDTGNGSLAFYEVNPEYPGWHRVSINTYCGRRHENRRYYKKGDTIVTRIRKGM